MGKRKSKGKRNDSHPNKGNKIESEACLPGQESVKQDTAMSRTDERMSRPFRDLFQGCCRRLRKSRSEYDFKLAESSSVQDKDRGKSDGRKITMIHNKQFTSLQREKTSKPFQTTGIEINTETIATDNELANIKIELDNECESLQELKEQLNDRNIVINQLENKIKELERDNATLTSTQNTLFDDKERYRKHHENDAKTIIEVDGKIKKLNANKTELEEEKQDTLRRLRKSTSKNDIEHEESSSVHHKRTTSQENDFDEGNGQKSQNIDNEKFTTIPREQKSNKIQIIDIGINTEIIATDNELANKKIEVNNECESRKQLEAQPNDRHIAIEQLEDKIKELEHDNAALASTQKTLFDDKERYRVHHENDAKSIIEMDGKIKKLNADNKILEEEKQDTLRRIRGIKTQYWNECVESVSPNKEYSPVHPQGQGSSEIVCNENEGHELTNIEGKGLTSLQKELERLQILFLNLETLLNDRHTIIKQHDNNIQVLLRNNATLKTSLKDQTDQKETMEKELKHQKQQYTNKLNDRERQIQKLNEDKKTLDEEKQEALRRLSAMMSTKLRDNNPNIADLSDQFRPTKLGEQFSELYDNEWTDAFDVLQNKFEERQAIGVLLDIVMETYWFCEQEISEEWKLTEKWFIQKDAPSAQQIKKTLKDARKQTLVGRVSEIEQKYTDYLLTLCSDDNLTVLVKSSPVKCYIASCVRLTLLMTANDPPVVIECPGWQRFLERPYEERETDVSTKEHESTIGLCESTATLNKDDSDSSRNNNSFQEEIKPNIPDGITIGKNHEGEFVALGVSNIKSGDWTSDTKTFAQEGNIVEIPTELPSAEMNICAKSNDTVNKLADSSENQVDSVGTTPNPIEFVNQPSVIKNDENTTQNKKTAHERAKESKTNENDGKIQLTKEKHDFEKDKFKEYTSRGPFVDYFVWPMLYLHRDGPMLAKGIAQGCKEKMEDVSQEPFVWWKRLPTSQM